MKHHTMNEACQHVKSIKYGKRRRQCASCRITWRTRPKKRGPKPRKGRVLDLERTFVEKLTIAQQSQRASVNKRGLAKRHARSLALLTNRPWPHEPPSGPLLLVIDALWFNVASKRQTVYLVGLRSVAYDTLYFLRPILQPGYESQKRWREVIEEMPEDVRERICALVSDSFTGSEAIAKEHGWVFQRCQAHLLLRLSTLCGNRIRTVSWREGRQEIQRLMHALMRTSDERCAALMADRLFALGRDGRCPVRLRYIISRTLRDLHEYRACYRHPEFRLPATTNAIENTNGRIRSLLNRSRGCRTPESLIQWITGFLWFHPTVTCRPKSPTKIRR